MGAVIEPTTEMVMIKFNPGKVCLVALCAIALAPLMMSVTSEAGVRVCGERLKMTKFLTGKYQESPKAVGVSSTGKSVLEIYTSSEGSWTVLMTTTTGVACIMGAGHSWQDRDQLDNFPKS